MLDGLGFDPADTNKRCGDFSGGWQMRIALAKVLVRRPENVLLDEPTNHLDAKTRDWLADELREWDASILIVTHDGEFLDHVATRILDLREKTIEAYAGNYTEYQRQKAARLQAQDQAAARQERELAKQERFIERFRAKATKTTRRNRARSSSPRSNASTTSEKTQKSTSSSLRTAAPNAMY